MRTYTPVRFLSGWWMLLLAVCLLGGLIWIGPAAASSALVGMPADLVLGQPDFNQGQPGGGQAGMMKPYGVAVDPASGKVFVSDSYNHRVLRFAALAQLSNGMAAEGVLGQPDFNANLPASGPAGMNTPMGLWADPAGRLWVADRGNHRVLRFDAAASRQAGSPANGVLGQPDWEANSPVTAREGLRWPSSVVVDSAGRLWVADTGNHRVLMYLNPEVKANGANADGVLGQPDYTSGAVGAAQNRLNSPSGLAVDLDGRLWVADWGNNRVLRFDNAASRRKGASANSVLGQKDFATTDYFVSQDRLNHPAGLSIDPAGRLWVVDQGNHRLVWFNQAALKPNGAEADGLIGQADFTSGAPNYGGRSASTLFYPSAVFYDTPAGALWAADTENQRILVYRSVKVTIQYLPLVIR
jgi:DNA-binding beta-propeller fold protein YncE